MTEKTNKKYIRIFWIISKRILLSRFPVETQRRNKLVRHCDFWGILIYLKVFIYKFKFICILENQLVIFHFQPGSGLKKQNNPQSSLILIRIDRHEIESRVAPGSTILQDRSYDSSLLNTTISNRKNKRIENFDHTR